ncbi:MAG: restriction endonuclease subunit S [Acutalibacteraceae bacterium]
MRFMKESGIEWIGEIPESWSTIRMKSCITKRDSGAWGDEPTGETGDIVCLRVADFDYNRFVFKDTDTDNLTKRHYSPDVIEKLKLNKNDILIEKSGGGEKTPVGRTVIFDKDYDALFANFLDRLKCAEFINPRYMQYTFVTFYKNQYIRNYIKQTTGIQNLDLTTMLSKETVPFPCYDEQKEIADFLDEKCAEIDTVIEKTKATIEEYKKLKQSVITQAVTKGIRHNRPMKDSGIEWIKKIPLEWNGINPKALFEQRKEKAKQGERQLTASQQYGVIYQEEYMKITGSKVVTVEKDFEILKHVEAGDFVISMRSFQGGLEYSEKTGSISSAYVMLIPNNKCVFPRYFRWLFKSLLYINALQSTSNMVRDGQAMRYSNFAQVRLYTVPLDEQKEIADYLDKKCSEIDELIAKKTAFLSELESYKKSLIYEYVTGKKEV